MFPDNLIKPFPSPTDFLRSQLRTISPHRRFGSVTNIDDRQERKDAFAFTGLYDLSVPLIYKPNRTRFFSVNHVFRRWFLIVIITDINRFCCLAQKRDSPLISIVHGLSNPFFDSCIQSLNQFPDSIPPWIDDRDAIATSSLSSLSSSSSILAVSAALAQKRDSPLILYKNQFPLPLVTSIVFGLSSPFFDSCI